MTRRKAAWGSVAVAVCALGVAGVPGCGNNRDKNTEPTQLEPWDGQLQELFDDQIHPAAIGMSMDAQSPARDPLLRLRTSNADIVGRMRIQTVTREQVGARTTFTMVIEPLGPPFLKPKIDQSRYELRVTQDSPAFGIVQTIDAAWQRGEKKFQFIGFVKRFPAEDGPVLHWHLTADTEEVAEVVQEVAVFEKAGNKEP